MTTGRDGLGANEILRLASVVVAAFVSNNPVNAEELPSLLQEVHDALRALAKGGTAFAGSREPAVSVSKSITPDYIICLEDGKKLRMLKRYLRTQYGLSPDEYRRKWGLPSNYPMVAPSYSKRRSNLAKEIGLGTSRVGTRKGRGRSRTAKAA